MVIRSSKVLNCGYDHVVITSVLRLMRFNTILLRSMRSVITVRCDCIFVDAYLKWVGLVVSVCQIFRNEELHVIIGSYICDTKGS